MWKWRKTKEEVTNDVTESVKEEGLEVDEEVVKEEPVEEAPAEDVPTEEAPAEDVPVEETPAEDVPAEEAPAEEAPVEEAPVEEAPAEEMPAEETSTEEVPAEETASEEIAEEKKKITISKKAVIITACTVLAVTLAVYFGFLIYFSERFVFNTTVNGMDCVGKTVKEVEKLMQSQVEDYVLTLEERHSISEEIKGVDIGIKYNGVDVIEDAFERQNPYFWFKSMFDKTKITANIDFEYDEKKLDEVIAKLDCLKEEKQITPISATPVYKNGAFEIEEEVYGTLVNQEQLVKTIKKSIDAMDVTVDLVENNCYIPPTYTKESPEVIAANEALNTCLKAEITYSLDGISVKVDATQIANWISVDANMAVIVDENQVRAFTDTLGTQYNTPNTAFDITTPTGKVVSIPNGRLGRVVGSAAECAELIEEIRGGVVTIRQPIFSQGATPEGEPVWGTTYIEVDISAQHMWYIVDGAVVFESDVITGSPGRDTPTGTFTILRMKRNKVLTGNIVPSTGQPEYRTPVDYWMRITWSGVGFHDATWQPGFGGQLYKQGYGSHGCINMPYNNVKTLYGMVSEGCSVVIHY